MGSFTAAALLEGLLFYLCFIPLLTFHEFAHAWTASKCGDDTAKDLGRVSLNPIVHMEMIGTVVLPWLGILLSISGSGLASFIVGWGKPVPVNLDNLKNPRRDDSLIAAAGPAMNLLLAVVCMAIVKIGVTMKNSGLNESGEFMTMLGSRLVYVNLLLAFFNLLPVPPLDGSHIVWNALRLSYELYLRIVYSGMSLILVIAVINIPGVREFLSQAIRTATRLLVELYRI
jgi:Zn-dependent protease